MINKIYKRINNKYPDFFKFLFFLRYVSAIFLIAISLFFSIPKFFNYEKKQEILKEYLVNYYGLEINNYSHIKFNVFPLPNLFLENVNLEIKDKPIKLKTKNLHIFLNFKNIYNYENFEAKKILFFENKVFLDVKNIKDLFNYFNKLKYKIDFQNLNLDLKKNDNSLLEIKNIYLLNYGYRKNKIKGEIFDRKFKAFFKNDNRDFTFKLLDTGIKADFKFDEKNLKDFIPGSSKINILNNLLKFDFILKNNQLEIIKSNFRNKDLSISFDGFVRFSPFFNFYSNIHINEIDKNFIDNLRLDNVLRNKKIIKKLNSNNNIYYKAKRYHSSLIKNYSSELSLAYGRLSFSNKILIAGGEINCQGDSLLTDEYPRLNFICLFNLQDNKKFFKKFLISQDKNNNQLNLNIEGSLNIFNRKINFKKINIERNYLAKEEDLKYFKERFEKILFDESFFGIFKMNKIKEFLLEVI